MEADPYSPSVHSSVSFGPDSDGDTLTWQAFGDGPVRCLYCTRESGRLASFRDGYGELLAQRELYNRRGDRVRWAARFSAG